MSMALRNLTLHGSVMFTQCQLCFSSECYITLQVWHVCGTGSHNFRSKSCSLQQECKFFLHTGKSAERPILSEDNIEHNVQSIQALLQRLLSQNGEQGIPEPVLLNNLDWFGTMPLLTFLRQV